LWSWQPWFKLKFVPTSQAPEEPISEDEPLDSGALLQSNVRIIRYVVRPGDTLSKIAVHYGVNVTVLSEYNHLANVDALRVGQRLRIPRRQNH
jgi:nucleoid-associated protein YgaU